MSERILQDGPKDNLLISFGGAASSSRSKYSTTAIYGVCQTTGPCLKCITLLFNDIWKSSIYQNVQLFIRSKNGILNAAIFKYSLHKI